MLNERIYPCAIHGEGKDRRARGDVERHACGCPVLRGEMQEIVQPVYDAEGEIIGVRFHPSLKAKELEAAKAQFAAMLRSAVNEEEYA
jgi:hypothetical protein